MTKGLIHQKYIAIPNVYSPNNRVEKHMKQKLIELVLNLYRQNSFSREIDKSTIIVANFNSLLSTIDRKTRRKICKDVELNSTTN